MSGYGIFRVEKIKASDTGSLIGRLKHSLREFSYENERTEKNMYAQNSWKTAFANYKNLTKDCVSRSNSVGAFEVVLTSSERTDWTQKQYDTYLAKAIDWAYKQFGEENCICATIHKDEKVPHAHLFFVPVETVVKKKKQTKEEKSQGIQRTETVKQLNAKRFFDGKSSLSAYQTDFYEKVTKKFGFERGESAEITHRTHQRITLDSEISRYKALNEHLESEIERFKGCQSRLEQFQDTLFNIPKIKNDVNLAQIFDGLSPKEIQTCWNQLRVFANTIRDQRAESSKNTLSDAQEGSKKGGKGSR